jgi:IS5 family transposase
MMWVAKTTKERASMRIKSDPQTTLDLGPSCLQVTQAYYQKYEKIDQILRDTPRLLATFHQDAAKRLESGRRWRRSQFTSEQFLRAILVMEIERLTYRDTIIRIDDSVFLRRFVGIPFGEVMDFTTLNKVYKAMRPQTWKKINDELTRYAIARESITGTSLRVDTTAYETNVHYPTESSLLWDGYRVIGRLIDAMREYAPEAVGLRRLHRRRVKRLAHLIARQSRHKRGHREKIEKPYRALLAQVSGIVEWAEAIQEDCRDRISRAHYDFDTMNVLQRLLGELEHFASLTSQVIDHTRRRVFEGEIVPHSEKLLSLFEPHTELLLRGKAGKPIEFGHMVLLHQVENRFISDYKVFKQRRGDESLVDGILSRHENQFGQLPENFAADKGFYKSMEKISELEERIDNVSISKKGSRTVAETEREHDPVFRQLQRFRAGIEGSISFLKRCFRMSRCLYRSFKTYCSSVGSRIFAHNLLILARL